MFRGLFQKPILSQCRDGVPSSGRSMQCSSHSQARDLIGLKWAAGILMEDERGRAKVNFVDKDHEKKEQQRKESEGKVSKVRD